MKKLWKQAAALTLAVGLVLPHLPARAAEAPPFGDIQGHWAQQAIALAEQRGLLHGMDDGLFAPEEPVTRGTFVAMLARLDDAALPAASARFSDVPADADYAPAIQWAVENEIAQGVTADCFAPEAAVTRQQAALLLDRYFSSRTVKLPTDQPVSFTDQGRIAPYAASSVSRMQQAGILVGRDSGGFDPLAPLTHAEAAALVDKAWNAVTSYESEVRTITAYDGYQLQGKLNVPHRGKVEQLVVFVNGSGPNTYDNRRSTGSMEFNYFDFFAQHFAREGAAFFSSSTRGVTPGDTAPLFANIDETGYQTYTPQNVVQDTESIIRALQQDERLKDAKIYLLGWSEGTMIAPKVAQRGNVRVDGLLLAGYVNGTMEETLEWQQTGGSSMVVYCQYFDYDGDGAVSQAEYEEDRYQVKAALGLAEVAFSELDLDKNGRLESADFAAMLADTKEALFSAIERRDDQWLAENYGVRLTSNWFWNHRAFTPNRDMLLELDLPISIFQGEADANVSVQQSRDIKAAFDQAGKQNLTLHTYAGADHDLNFAYYLATGSLPQGFVDLFHSLRTL